MGNDFGIIVPIINYIVNNYNTDPNASKAKTMTLGECAENALNSEKLEKWNKIKSNYDSTILAFTDDCCGEMRIKTYENYQITNSGLGVNKTLAELLGKNLIHKPLTGEITTYPKKY